MKAAPQIRQISSNTPIVVSREAKKLLGLVREYNGASKTKTAKVLEASDLRAFNKVYIIGNQRFINLIVELMCCFELRNTVGVIKQIG